MEILEVSADEYAETLKTPYHAYNSAAFNLLNSTKCDAVFYLLFREGKFRLGIVGGSQENSFHSPFSAPFGGFSFVSGDIRLQYIEEAIRLLQSWADDKEFASIRLTLPPPVYGGDFIAKQANCLWRGNFDISAIDLNYSFNLEAFNGNYPERIWYNARKNLQVSLKSGLHFIICTADDEKKLAYNIIKENRESRGYPLRMTWQQVSETVRIIQADFFLVYKDEQTPVASALVFHVGKSIVQVIYWGDLLGHSEVKPVNFIAFKLFEYYKSAGKRIVDIGPSTENSLPNYGLCDFKESIGCEISPKYTFRTILI